MLDKWIDKVHCGDYLELMKQLPDGCVDAVITDPPYGGKLVADWDVGLDATAFCTESNRCSREFVAWFGQFPASSYLFVECTLAAWHLCEHVVWVKRNSTPSDRLNRMHESVFVWATGERKQFHATTGPYEDVKVPGVLVDAISVAGVQRYISTLHSILAGKSTGEITHGEGHKWGSGSKFSAGHTAQRAPRNANFTNVWSFFPPNCRPDDVAWHPNRKPIPVMERLIEMLTPEGGTVLDPFLGSGTTAAACVNTGRHFIGMEISEDYCAIAEERIAKARRELQPALF